jgi:hypothetical protein
MAGSELIQTRTNASLGVKIIAAIGVVWYAFGLLQFWLAYSMDTSQSVAGGEITQSHAAAIDGTPIFIWLAFAIASGAGLLGSAFLFRGASAAKSLFAISLVSAAIYYGWVYVISGTASARPSEELIIAGVVLTVTLGFLVLSRRVT